MGEAGIKDIPAIRKTFEQVIREESVSAGTANDARKALDSICDEASKYGLTRADVVRSLLRPVLEPKQECDCPTCKLRRGELESTNSEPANHR